MRGCGTRNYLLCWRGAACSTEKHKPLIGKRRRKCLLDFVLWDDDDDEGGPLYRSLVRCNEPLFFVQFGHFSLFFLTRPPFLNSVALVKVFRHFLPSIYSTYSESLHRGRNDWRDMPRSVSVQKSRIHIIAAWRGAAWRGVACCCDLLVSCARSSQHHLKCTSVSGRITIHALDKASVQGAKQSLLPCFIFI